MGGLLDFDGVHPFVNVKFSDRRQYCDAFDACYRNQTVEPMRLLIAEYVNERLGSI